MPGQVYGLEKYINRAALGTNERANNELGVNIHRFLKYIETNKGWVTEIARNTGPGPGVNTDSNFWDEANPALSPFWSFWRWNASARRPKDSYFLFQFGASPTIGTGVGAPARVNGSSAPSANGIGFSWAAFLDNTLTAQNPWNGSPATTKANPVYKNAGVGETLLCLPFSNAPGGTYAASRENLTGFGSSSSPSTAFRLQCIADEDNIFIQSSRDGANPAWSFFLSGYIPLPGVVVDFPMIMCSVFTGVSVSVLPLDTSAVGNAAGNATYEGGIVTPSGVKVANIMSNYSFLTEPGYQPNPNISGSAWDSDTIFVGANGAGRLGKIDFDFMRVLGQISWGSVLDSGVRVALDAVVGGRSRVALRWDGSTSPGSGSTRVGVDSFT